MVIKIHWDFQGGTVVKNIWFPVQVDVGDVSLIPESS